LLPFTNQFSLDVSSLVAAAQVEEDGEEVEAGEEEEVEAEAEEDTGPRIKRFSLQSKSSS
jgi:hypothetical protein